MSLFDQVTRQHYNNPPDGWQTRKIKFLADVQTSNVDKISVDGEEPTKLCNYTDVYYNDRIAADMDFMEATATLKEIEKFTLRAGQVLITKDSEAWDDIGIPALVAEDMPGVLCGYHLAMFTPRDEIDGGYFAWLCRADALNDQFTLSANGVTRFGLGQYAMKNAVISFPPIEVQKRIAAFLDERTARTDALIAKKQALLERLAEKRQAIITQAVTKGLNPAAPMKDSGIDWLGQIPAHWGIIPLKWQCSIQSGQVDPTQSPYDEMTLIAPDHIESGTGRLLAKQSSSEQAAISGKYLCHPGQVLYSKIRPALRKVTLTNEWCLCSADMYAIAPGLSFERDFLFYFLLTDAFTSYAELASMRVAMPKVNREALGSFPLLKPPVNEQQSISTAIANRLLEIDRVVTAIKNSVNQLLEYRSTLVSAAVIGKIVELR